MTFLKTKRGRGLVWLCAVLAVLVLACVWYLGDYYRADRAAIAAFAEATSVEGVLDGEGNLVFLPEDARVGFLFYPGGKVEYTAYVPLMQSLASRGIACVLVEMPFHLAVLDVDAAEGIPERFPQVEHWYIGGHSLGGSMAAAYLESCHGDFEGLILLGSYSAADLSETDLAVLSVYGSEDTVLNREKYGANRANLPEGFAEVVLEGGCHAGFAMYGPQSGDGIPTLSREEQIALTADAIAEAVGR